MCEDLGAEPLFVINCGMSHRENVPLDQMGEFVQDALDAIEYCNGPADSRWGAVRAKAGHPQPFQLKFSLNRGDVVLPVEVDAPIATEKPKGGAIGVGTWLTQAEFKDIRVARGNETLYTCDLARGTEGWKLLGGDWKVQDGVLRQSSGADNVRAVVGDKSWNDYTYSLKARKLGGAEGFLFPGNSVTVLRAKAK